MRKYAIYVLILILMLIILFAVWGTPYAAIPVIITIITIYLAVQESQNDYKKQNQQDHKLNKKKQYNPK